MKNVFYMIIITAIVIFACLNASLITSGCSQGIYLWYSSIVPVLLPFMLLTSVILNSADLNHMSACCACMLTLIIGLFCGFPTGTITISFLYKNDRIGRHTAQTMLPICNNVSPMFLYGYLYSSYLYKYISINTLLACLLIACTTFLISVGGVKIGNVFGTRYQKKAEITGGIILICLGIKILIEHF